ncbi:hypothetical protein MKW94_027050 [Papaver nudicaule]|uniref:glucose-1-phosphate adenylyltransferase n=1 Tax=Papaver nudicaule TaxID=74823 RepID=A0AA41V4Q4_PAPNU|nr:hypothetical protein [Papaver nudicaule]
MEACLATLQANTHLVKVGKGGGVDNGFWGETIRGNLINSKKVLKKSSFLRSEFRNGKTIKGNGGIGCVSSTQPGPVLSKKIASKIADPNSVASIILGGSFEIDTKPVSSFLLDGGVPVSSCIDSGINNIFIFTQLTFASLNRNPRLRKAVHEFQHGVDFKDGCIELLAPTQKPEDLEKKWFEGTTPAFRRITWDAKNKNIENIMILSGDHIYRTDYMDFVQKHIDTNADISVACVSIDDSIASDYGLMMVDSSGRITQFAQKPKGDDLKAMLVDTTVLGLPPEKAIRFPFLAATGTYVFRTDVLLKLVMSRLPISVDFESEIIPAAVLNHNAQVRVNCSTTLQSALAFGIFLP